MNQHLFSPARGRKPLLWACVLGMALMARAEAQGQGSPAAVPAGAEPTESGTQQREQVQQLVIAVQAAEERVRSSEHELDDLKARLLQLQASLGGAKSAAIYPASSGVAGINNQQSATAEGAKQAPSTEEQAEMQASEIATLDQSKVETNSKYPLKLNGLVLLTGGVNTAAVDSPVAPTASLFGQGSTVLSLRQTILGFDASGPHLAGATSSADVRVDFFGSSSGTGYPTAGGFLRLRTAHAALDWSHARLFFALDRPLLSPDVPASLVQVAEPGLAWSGNLWNWSPQLGVSTHFGDKYRIIAEGAWISPPDAPYPSRVTGSGSTTELPSLSETSRVPGGEARVAVAAGDPSRGPRFGIGGYVSPHTLEQGESFTSWAGTADVRLPLTRRMDFVASAYRGQGLGGLGAGGYKDYVYGVVGDTYELLAPEDAGGWAQMTVHLSHTLDWNSAFGMDDIRARQVRFLTLQTNDYGNIARNRTLSSNVVWAPKAALLFSFEYRRLSTYPITGRVWNTNIFAGAAGYRF